MKTTVIGGPWFEDFERGHEFDAPAPIESDVVQTARDLGISFGD